MACEATAIVKTAIVSLGVIGVLGQPVLAKHAKTAEPVTTQSAPLATDLAADDPATAVEPTTTSDPGVLVLNDAIKLCQLVVDNRQAIIGALDDGGWNSDIDYDVGNAPFYKEISADREYEGAGKAEIWGFLEDYPGYEMGYCSFEILSPQVKIDLSMIDVLPDMVGELIVGDEKTNGAWRNDAGDVGEANIFIHAFESADTFFYQISMIKNLNK
ncbi:MAG: hypothetical protein L3J21_01900 [Devosiaceae bacterium]|nr:hypothetical protein [Devosiaceae bacterium]